MKLSVLFVVISIPQSVVMDFFFGKGLLPDLIASVATATRLIVIGGTVGVMLRIVLQFVIGGSLSAHIVLAHVVAGLSIFAAGEDGALAADAWASKLSFTQQVALGFAVVYGGVMAASVVFHSWAELGDFENVADRAVQGRNEGRMAPKSYRSPRALIFLSIRLEDAVHWVGSYVGPWGAAAFENAMQWLLFSNNRLGQVAYIFLLWASCAGFVSIFVSQYQKSQYVHVDPYLEAYHMYIGAVMLIICLYMYIRACIADPGIVQESNVKVLCATDPWDNTIYRESECATCRIVKPARSKHCTWSGVCVARFERHCTLFNQCVGAGNARYFLGFLVSHLAICLYGFYLGMMILRSWYAQMKAASKETREERVGEAEAPALSMIFCILEAMWLLSMLFTQLRLISFGATANDAKKWKEFRKTLEFQHGHKEGRKMFRQKENIYNKGFAGNLKSFLTLPNSGGTGGGKRKGREKEQ